MFDIDQAVAEGRAEAEAIMTAQCVVRRPIGEPVNNPDFTVSRSYEVVYNGKAKPTTYEGHETTVVAGESSHVVQRSTVHFPVGAFSPIPGDIVTITYSRDALLIGRSFRVVQQYPVKEHATAYRVFVDENIGEFVPPLD